MAKYYGQLITIVLSSLVAATYAIVFAYVISGIIDDVVYAKDLQQIYFYISLTIIAFLINVIATSANIYFRALITINVLNDLRLMMYNALICLPVQVTHNLSRKNLLSNFSYDLSTIDNSLMNSIPKQFQASINMVMILITIYWYNIQLGIITTLFIPATFTMTTIFRRIAKRAAHNSRKRESDIIGQASESIYGKRIISIFHLNEKFIGSFSSKLQALKKFFVIREFFAAFINAITLLSANILLIIIFIVGIYLSNANQLTIGSLVAIVSLCNKLTDNFKTVTSTLTKYYKSASGLQKILELIQKKNDIACIEKNITLTKIQLLELKDISFAFDTSSLPILSHIDLSISENSSTGILGPSGSGKSTLLDLMSRIYQPTSGTIFMNDRNIFSYTDSSFAQKVSYVNQQPIFFEGTLFENLTITNSALRQKDILPLLEKLDLHDWIMSLEDGYDTVITDQGKSFSGGQSQRLSIARALLHQPHLLLLDEPSSALDKQSENIIKELLIELRNKMTIVCVTHNRALVDHMDQILFLDNTTLSH